MKYLKTEVYNSTLDGLGAAYPTQSDVRAFLTQANIAEASIDLQGNALHMWDSVLGLVMQSDRLDDLVDKLKEANPGNKAIAAFYNQVKNGEAYLPDSPITDFVANDPNGKKVEMMLIYDPADEEKIAGVRDQLKVLEMAGALALKDMNSGIAGNSGNVDQSKMLQSACALLLFITPRFFINSANKCVELAFTAHQLGKRIVPVLVQDCAWSRIKFLQNIISLPRNNKFIPAGARKVKVEAEIADEIDKLATYLQANNLCP